MRCPSEYAEVQLRNLDGSGYLTGDYAKVLSQDRQAGVQRRPTGSSTRAIRTSSSR